MSENIANITIASDDISADIVKIETWRSITNPVSRWEITLDNSNSQHNNKYYTNQVMVLDVLDKTLLYGLLDSGKRIYSHEARDSWHKQFVLSGRDLMQDLDNLTVDASIPAPYVDPINTLIPRIFTEVGASMDFVNLVPATNPSVIFDSKERIQLNRGIQQILLDAGFESYGDGWEFKILPLGTVSSGIILKCLDNDATNNIISPDVELTEFDDTERHNVAIVKGGQLNDGFTDMNAQDFQALGGDTLNEALVSSGGGTTISNWQGIDPKPPFAGASAIKVDNAGSRAYFGCKLTFPRYNLFYLDFHRIWHGNFDFRFLWYQSYNPGPSTIDVVLEDTAGKTIRYAGGPDFLSGYRLTGGPYYATPISMNGRWQQFGIVIGPGSVDKWTGYREEFNWKVKSMSIVAWFQSNIQYFMIDALNMPITQYGLSDQSYGANFYRQRIYNRSDIRYQWELQNYATQICTKRKNSLGALKLTALGNAGLINNAWTWHPGLNFQLQTPDGTTTWRFINLHTIIEKNVMGTGANHIVEIDALPYNQPFDLERYTYMTQGDNSGIRTLHDRVKVIETSMPQALEFTS